MGEAKAQAELGGAQDPKEPETPQDDEPATSLSAADKVKLREALKTMVRQGLMSKAEARETYRARTGKQ